MRGWASQIRPIRWIRREMSRIVVAGKNGEMGVGTLVIFIALLLVAAIAAGVLIQTSGSLQEKSLTTGDQAKGQVATNVRVTEVSGTDGTDGELTDFTYIARLAGGSDPVKLSQVVFTVNTYDKTATLAYRGVNSVGEHNHSAGYNTVAREELGELRIFESTVWRQPKWVIITYTGTPTGTGLDLDGDGINDTIMTCYSGVGGGNCPAQYLDTYFEVNLSSDGAVYVPARNVNGTLANFSSQDGFNLSNVPIPGGYGYISGFRLSGSAPGRIARALDPATFEVITSKVTLNDDLDGDGRDDYFAVNQTHALVFLSNQSSPSAYPLTASIKDAGAALAMSETISDAGGTLGSFVISGTTTSDNTIDEDMAVTIIPEHEGTGYFSVVYLAKGSNFINGNLQRGDLIKLYFEGPRAIGEGEDVRLNFIPKMGSPTLTEFITPEVISEERIYLYP